jgi:hypothetical protein
LGCFACKIRSEIVSIHYANLNNCQDVTLMAVPQTRLNQMLLQTPRMNSPVKPRPDLIDAHLQKWENLENYRIQKRALGFPFDGASVVIRANRLLRFLLAAP